MQLPLIDRLSPSSVRSKSGRKESRRRSGAIIPMPPPRPPLWLRTYGCHHHMYTIKLVMRGPETHSHTLHLKAAKRSTASLTSRDEAASRFLVCRYFSCLRRRQDAAAQFVSSAREKCVLQQTGSSKNRCKEVALCNKSPVLSQRAEDKQRRCNTVVQAGWLIFF